METAGTARRFAAYFKVRHYEMDALGHVNNAVYLHYMEQAAIEHAAALGYTMERLRELGGLFISRRHEIDYLRPATAGDVLQVVTWAVDMKGAQARASTRSTATAHRRTRASRPTACCRPVSWRRANHWCAPARYGCGSTPSAAGRAASRPSCTIPSWRRPVRRWPTAEGFIQVQS